MNFRRTESSDSYRFFVVENESVNEITLSRQISDKIESKSAKNGIFWYL